MLLGIWAFRLFNVTDSSFNSLLFYLDGFTYFRVSCREDLFEVKTMSSFINTCCDSKKVISK